MKEADKLKKIGVPAVAIIHKIAQKYNLGRKAVAIYLGEDDNIPPSSIQAQVGDQPEHQTQMQPPPVPQLPQLPQIQPKLKSAKKRKLNPLPEQARTQPTHQKSKLLSGIQQGTTLKPVKDRILKPLPPKPPEPPTMTDNLINQMAARRQFLTDKNGPVSDDDSVDSGNNDWD